jgi:hypothetical protein
MNEEQRAAAPLPEAGERAEAASVKPKPRRRHSAQFPIDRRLHRVWSIRDRLGWDGRGTPNRPPPGMRRHRFRRLITQHWELMGAALGLAIREDDQRRERDRSRQERTAQGSGS